MLLIYIIEIVCLWATAMSPSPSLPAVPCGTRSPARRLFVRDLGRMAAFRGWLSHLSVELDGLDGCQGDALRAFAWLPCRVLPATSQYTRLLDLGYSDREILRPRITKAR